MPGLDDGPENATADVAARLKSHDFSPIEMSLGEPQAPSWLTSCRVSWFG